MKRKELESSVPFVGLMLLVDICVVLVSMVVSRSVLSWYSPGFLAGVPAYSCAIVAAFSYLALSFFFPPVLSGRGVRSDQIVQRCFNQAVLLVLVSSGLQFLILDVAVPRSLLVSFFLVFTTMLCIERLCVRKVINYIRAKGGDPKNVIVAGSCEALRGVLDSLRAKECGCQVTGIFTEEYDEGIGIPCLGCPGDVEGYLHQHQEVSEVYAAMSSFQQDELLKLYGYCENHALRFFVLPDVLNVPLHRMAVAQMGDSMTLYPCREPLCDWANRLLKRLMDIVISSTFLLTLFPVIYVIVAIIVKRKSPGPVLHIQEYGGRNGRPFKCLNFRTTHLDGSADAEDPSEEPQSFGFGDFMCRAKIDKLPQFINVLCGDMSVVGPRPRLLSDVEEYSRLVNRYMVRRWVKPGVTGWAQMQGVPEETPVNNEDRQVQADIWYVENWTFWLDVRIIVRSLLAR